MKYFSDMDQVTPTYVSAETLSAGRDTALAAPADLSPLAMIVARPDVDQRTTPQLAELRPGIGLVGDNYLARGSGSTPDGAAHPEAEITIMNTRVLDVVAGGDRSRWPLAGDQLLVDMDLSIENMPAGTRLVIGADGTGPELEITAKPHTGCPKFSARFGPDAMRWVNANREYRFRGVNARVITAGTCAVGDIVSKKVSQ